jgi:hypothetical protein
MRRVLIGTVVLIVVVLIPSLASAQAKRGDKEVLLNGQLISINQSIENPFTGASESSTFTTGNGVVNLGVFFSDTLEIGGGPSISITSAGGDTTASVGANGFLRKYFHSKRPTVAPFVAIEASEQDFSDFSNQLFVDADFGVKNYLNERAALEIVVGYGLNPAHPGDFQMLQIKAGLTVLFGK